MEIVLLILFSYLIYKQAKKAEERPMKWVFRFSLFWLLLSTIISILGTQVFGIQPQSDFSLNVPEDQMLPLVLLSLINVAIVTAIFVWMYSHLHKLASFRDGQRQKEEEQKEEKDLSYFR